MQRGRQGKGGRISTGKSSLWSLSNCALTWPAIQYYIDVYIVYIALCAKSERDVNLNPVLPI